MFEWLHNLLTPWLSGMLVTLAVTGAKIITLMVGLLIGVAYLTLAERKGLAAMQLRRGANRVGPWGLLQPFADGLKLVHKEIIIPTGADKALFLLAPVLTFGLALAAWAVMPVGQGVVIANINIGLLYVFAISSLGVYGIILAGWASNSMYALLGGVRAAAQMISYEVSMGLVILSVVLTTGSLNLTEIVNAQQGLWFMVPHFPMFVLFFIITLAETNRTPFDLPEAESELAGGYNVEYSSVPFAVFFLAEYANMILMCAITTLLFLGGWLPPFDVWPLKAVPGPIWFALKVSLLLFGFIWVRATVPRYRYDQLMAIGWKVCLPLALAWFVATALFLYITGGLPA